MAEQNYRVRTYLVAQTIATQGPCVTPPCLHNFRGPQALMNSLTAFCRACQQLALTAAARGLVQA